MASISPPSPTNSPSEFAPPGAPPPLPTPAISAEATPCPVLYADARTGRRPKFTPEDDLLLVREVAASKAHVAPNGATKERFETAAQKANATRRLTCPVTWKSVQDRYKRIQTRFDESERIEGLMSGVGGEVGEMEELLSSMREARQDLLNSRSQTRKAAQEREAEKERLGAQVRAKAMHRERRSSSPDADVEGAEEESSDPGTTPAKRRSKRKRSDFSADPFQDDIAAFTDALRKSEEARLSLEEQRLTAEVEEGRRDREERRAEREEANKLELEKFKLMMQAFKHG